MTFLILLALIATVLAAAGVRAAAHDGRGPTRPPASHHEDRHFRPPALY